MTLVLLLMLQGRTSGGHGLLEATPRIYQVTPDIPDRRRATKQKESQALARPTASKRVSSPPVGTIPSASDVTDSANHNSKPPSSSANSARNGPRYRIRPVVVSTVSSTGGAMAQTPKPLHIAGYPVE